MPPSSRKRIVPPKRAGLPAVKVEIQPPGRRQLEDRLGIRFRNPSLLELALTHRSVANESPSAAANGDNERLEFLGDAVLGLVVAEQLYRAFPDASEGALTVMRAQLVRRSSLAAWARRLDLGEQLILGKGEARAGGRRRDGVLAACLEAVIGAVFLDRGQRAVRAVVEPLVTHELPQMSATPQSADAKSELQRRVQTATGRLPLYRVMDVRGPEHQPQFTVEVDAGPGLIAQGVGSTKQAAEQQAAQRVLDEWPDNLATHEASEGPA